MTVGLFTPLARDERLFERLTGGGLLDRGHLTLRQREIVIDRVTINCGSEYEWGVHVAMFAEMVGRAAPNDVRRCPSGAVAALNRGRYV
jgi:hypothetical protein